MQQIWTTLQHDGPNHLATLAKIHALYKEMMSAELQPVRLSPPQPS